MGDKCLCILQNVLPDSICKSLIFKIFLGACPQTPKKKSTALCTVHIGPPHNPIWLDSPLLPKFLPATMTSIFTTLSITIIPSLTVSQSPHCRACNGLTAHLTVLYCSVSCPTLPASFSVYPFFGHLSSLLP